MATRCLELVAGVQQKKKNTAETRTKNIGQRKTRCWVSTWDEKTLKKKPKN